MERMVAVDTTCSGSFGTIVSGTVASVGGTVGIATVSWIAGAWVSWGAVASRTHIHIITPVAAISTAISTISALRRPPPFSFFLDMIILLLWQCHLKLLAPQWGSWQPVRAD